MPLSFVSVYAIYRCEWEATLRNGRLDRDAEKRCGARVRSEGYTNAMARGGTGAIVALLL